MRPRPGASVPRPELCPLRRCRHEEKAPTARKWPLRLPRRAWHRKHPSDRRPQKSIAPRPDVASRRNLGPKWDSGVLIDPCEEGADLRGGTPCRGTALDHYPPAGRVGAAYPTVATPCGGSDGNARGMGNANTGEHNAGMIGHRVYGDSIVPGRHLESRQGTGPFRWVWGYSWPA